MSGEIIGAEEETYSPQLLLNCTLTETDGCTDMLLMALVPSQACCTPSEPELLSVLSGEQQIMRCYTLCTELRSLLVRSSSLLWFNKRFPWLTSSPVPQQWAVHHQHVEKEEHLCFQSKLEISLNIDAIS